MTLPVPNLDDRDFDQLAGEARALIPRNLPAWTDHNPSDPGITLQELFAFLVEIGIYQLNRVPERSLRRFADLVSVASSPNLPIEVRLREALDALERRERAITAAEFEDLARAASPDVARSKAVVEVIDTPTVFPDDQIVRVVVVPNEPNEPAPQPSDALRETVFSSLRARRLLTTRVQVVPPRYADVRIEVVVVRDAVTLLTSDDVRRGVESAIRGFLSPLDGGVDGTGWEFGRAVFRSELYQRIEGLPGVDHTRRLLMNGDDQIGELPLAPASSLERSRSLVRLAELRVTVVDG
jgi:hypothetical protein